MPRKPPEPTATVSICVTPDEQDLVRQAAALANVSVSSWSASAIVVAMSSKAGRIGIRQSLERLEKAPVARGARASRVSAVLRVHDHMALKDTARLLDVTPHAIAQAVVIESAAADVARVPPALRAARTEARNPAASRTVVMVPEEFADVDPDILTSYLAALCAATSVRILDGKGRVIADGVAAFAGRSVGASMVAIPVDLPALTFDAPAHVLDVPSTAYASALAVKACRHILAS